MQATGGGNWPRNGPFNYIEDVFSTFLYAGNNSTQTITNGIDLTGKGGLVWIKSRSQATRHCLFDTVRGAYQILSSDNTFGSVNTSPYDLTAFTNSGFTLGESAYGTNAASQTYASWTFREQPKFFDVVTFTGNGAGDQFVSHNLQSSYGFIAIKRTDSTSDWFVLSRNASGDYFQLKLNSTAANTGLFSADPNTATGFFPSSVIGAAAVNGGTYVAYLFAHNAGGFGLSGDENVISCGSYTGNGSFPNGPVIDVGFEPQWVMVKRATGGTGKWLMLDTMRGWTANSGNQQGLWANTSEAEAQNASGLELQTRGWQLRDTDPEINGNGSTYIYIAIRRGPMAVPTTGTSVFNSIARAGTSAVANITGVGFTPDTVLIKNRGGSVNSVDWSYNFFDRLRNPGFRLSTAFTNAEDTSVSFITSLDMDGMTLPSVGYTATNGSYNYINHFFKRAPGFFDEVCYTGTGANRTVAHNLAAVPELMIVKGRTNAANWSVYSGSLGSGISLSLNTTQASFANAIQWIANPTASVFSVGTSNNINGSGITYVAYLFASCPGVSKVGSFTGTGATQVINCGFTGGARFVMIKSTSTTGDWYVWDSARGIVAGNDPYLALNSTAAEVTGTDWVDTAASGFELSNAAGNLANSNGVSYIFLAIA
jgi:hypothetical protein